VELGTTDGRYALRRELARGGMGRIWIADDLRLARRVAIKELVGPDANRAARFDRELALTSRLEHPSIVSVHDGGRWADGTAFYVMRLVNGESLARVIARAASPAERIALLPHGIAVADALAYAHAQAIVHRDLKPENILIGDFGETVVIDWGLAKDLLVETQDPFEALYRAPVGDGATIGGAVMGTPAYMPPEQAMGDAVDERADVYALGAVLYQLLSGTPPHRGGSVDEVLASVITAQPPPLATRGVPPDLVAIVEKAMAPRPEDRYPTANELAIDLKRFQSGQLVGAHHYTGWQLLGRWLRKYRAAVAVATIAALVLVIVGAIGFQRIVGERVKAEQNHAKAEALVSFMLVELRRKLEPIGRLELLESVMLATRDYYLAQSDPGTDEDQHRRAVALHGLGDVLAEKGDAAAALSEHRAALAIHQRLAARDPRWRASYAASATAVGDAMPPAGESDGALATYRIGLALNEALVAERPDDAAALQQLATSYTSIGAFYFDHHRDVAGALVQRERALEIHRRLVALAPYDVGRTRDLVRSLAGVAELHLHRGDFERAAAMHREALTLVSTIAQADPTDAISQSLLADCEENLGGVFDNQGDGFAARELARSSLAIRERLIGQDPTNAAWRGDLARSEMKLGRALEKLGDLAGAAQHHRRAIQELDRLVSSHTTRLRMRSDHGIAERLLGQVLTRQGKIDLAIAALESSLATAEAVAAEEPANQRWLRELAFTHTHLADARAQAGELGSALEHQRKALALAEQLAARDATNASSQYELADRLMHLGELLVRHAEPEPARAAFKRALAIDDALVAQAPSNKLWVERARTLRGRLAP